MTTVHGGHEDQWRVHALCAQPGIGPQIVIALRWLTITIGATTDAWFPEKGGGRLARRVCATCPVRRDCLDFAVTTREEFGIWGGAGEPARRDMTKTLMSKGRTAYLIEVQDHFDREDELARTGLQPVGARRVNGPGAQHGKASSYARGCRCEPCREAMRESHVRRRQGDKSGGAA